MAVTNFSPLLGLALPTTGDLNGTWGTTVNDSITSLTDSAVAGTTTLSTDADVTLSTTNGAANQARQAVLLCTGSRSVLRTITAPAQSKAYIVINATTGGYGVKVVGSGPTAGVTIANGEKALIAWNGSDFVKVSSSTASGDVVGPASATDNAIARFDGTTGKLIKNSAVTVADTTGDITGGKYNKVTITAPATGSTLTVADGKTLTTNNSLTLAGTDGTTMTFPSTSATVAGLGVAQTFTATQTFSGSSSTLGAVLTDTAEVATVSATAATGTINYDVTTQSVLYYTSNASANWTVNFRGSSGTSLNTLMSTGQSLTVAFLVTQGATAYYNSTVQIDGSTSGVTTKWLGGAPTAGNASGIDSYRYLIIKTGSATFTVLASVTQFK